MAERAIGREVLDGLREIKANKEGNMELRKRTFQPPPPAKEIRA